ncbi:MAG: hypothetical protein K2J26_01305 [Ruminococcus sp.]|nr:hypothetical protein [Ruminococcus sp.]
MIQNGVDVKTVQACLGHNDANTTIPVPNSNTKPTQYLPTIILISKGRFHVRMQGIFLIFQKSYSVSVC